MQQLGEGSAWAATVAYFCLSILLVIRFKAHRKKAHANDPVPVAKAEKKEQKRELVGVGFGDEDI